MHCIGNVATLIFFLPRDTLECNSSRCKPAKKDYMVHTTVNIYLSHVFLVYISIFMIFFSLSLDDFFVLNLHSFSIHRNRYRVKRK